MGEANRGKKEIEAEVVSSCMLQYTTVYSSLKTLLTLTVSPEVK